MGKKQKKKSKGWIIVLSIIALLILYFFVFVIWRPFDNEITQDRPIIKLLCQMQTACHYVTGPWPCEDLTEEDWMYQKIRKWDGYNGCNESSDGFNNGVIMLGYCSCGGLM